MKKTEVVRFRTTPELKKQIEQVAEKDGRTVSNYIEFIIKKDLEEHKMLEKVYLYGMDEEVTVNMDQKTFIDEDTGYEIYVTEDGRWIAEDEAINEWVQIKG